MYNMKYRVSYATRYDPDIVLTTGQVPDFAYLEITTRSGRGPFLKKTPSTYLYRPLVTFNSPKEFYRPHYSSIIKNSPNVDLRSTIHWEPHLVTDKNGEAQVSFIHRIIWGLIRCYRRQQHERKCGYCFG